MGSEELNLMQIFRNLYQKKNVLLWIIIVFTIIALAYSLVSDMLIKETSAIVLIDKADASIADTIAGLNTSKVKIEFDKNKKTIAFTSSGIDSKNCELQIQHQINVVKEKLTDTYSIALFKTIQDVKTESISVVKVIKDIAIFEVVGIVLYCGYVFLITSFASTTDEYTIKNITNLKVLGKLYKPEENKKENKIISKFIDPEENISMEKQLRIIKTNIELKKDNKDPRTILFANADKRVKNDEVIRLLAKEYSTDNKKIMILAYNIENYEKIGLNAINTMKLSDNDSKIEEAEELLNELVSNYDLVFVDGANINENHLSIIFSSIVDSNIIVANMEKTKMEDIIKTKQYIDDVDGKISGIILSKIK
ncbi:MAG: hypothetical protein J6M60_07370 [Clostridia bacterium]|nr:hypothetical protein [Clostridia bacterium]